MVDVGLLSPFLRFIANSWTRMVYSWVAAIFSNPVGARLAFYPSVLWGIFKEGPGRRWYDRIDKAIVLGAIPFKNTAEKVIRPR